MSIYKKLLELGLPVFYMVNEDATQPPFIVYKGAGASTFLADDSTYHKKYDYSIEFCFDRKNEELEDRLENLFDRYGYIWDKSEDVYIPDEKMNIIYYTI